MKTKPRLLAFTTSYFPAVGGAEVALRQVAERLAADFEIAIVTSRGRADVPRAESLKEGSLHRLGCGRPIDRWLLPLLALLLRHQWIPKKNAAAKTLLWGVDITQASLAAAWVRRYEPSARLVLTIQYGGDPARVAKGRWGWNRRAFRSMLSKADHVTAISSPLVHLARTNGYTRPVSWIPNGVDLERFRRRGPPPSGTPPVIITISRLVRKNGIDTLLHAVHELTPRHAALQCRILGDGPERPRLERLAAELGIQDRVRFCGTIPHEDLPGFLWQSDVFVRPSRSEGMGSAFLEAMAAEVPVVGTPVGGLPDFLRDGETGLVASVDDPPAIAGRIGLILTNKELAATLVGKGLAMVRDRYDADAIARQYARVFEETLAR